VLKICFKRKVLLLKDLLTKIKHGNELIQASQVELLSCPWKFSSSQSLGGERSDLIIHLGLEECPLHVAGTAHIPAGKMPQKSPQDWYETQLAYTEQHCCGALRFKAPDVTSTLFLYPYGLKRVYLCYTRAIRHCFNDRDGKEQAESEIAHL